MSSTPALVALDIDGTLLDWDGTMREDTHAAVQRVLKAGVPVVLSTFDPTDAVHTILREAPGVRIAVEVVGEGYRVNRRFPEGELQGVITVQSVDELCAEPVTRVVVRDPEVSHEDFHRMARGLGLKDVEYSVGYSQWLDIAPQGVSKATGLQYVCDELGVDASRVLAMGDGENDIEMLQWAGRGVAMGDVAPVVMSAADEVTAPFREGGLAQELGRWF